MRFDAGMLKIYAITDRECLRGRDLFEQVEQAILGGATMIQLRDKKADKCEMIETARKLTEICHRYSVPLIVNDDYKIALESGADGVHVGAGDGDPAEIRRIAGADFIIGVTAKTVEQAKKAQSDGADYIGTGAVFPSPTKTDAIRITPEMLREICAAVDIPAVAIGGITAENVWQLRGCGNRGVAVVSAVFGAENVRAAAQELDRLWDKIYGLRTALTIAGSDCSGGAGIQADIKTMQQIGVYAMSVITALTAQNTTGVSGIFDVPAGFTAQQIDMVFEDIRPDAVKIGMISSAETAKAVAERLKFYKAVNIVVDPVAVATSGSALSGSEAYEAVKEDLFPIAALITPNIPEAELISGIRIHSPHEMEKAARLIFERHGCAVLLKGGHSVNDANDYLLTADGGKWFEGKRIDNPNTHGTGCTLSSAAASFLAKGYSLETAVRAAKDYVSDALNLFIDLGKGSGPLGTRSLYQK